MNEIRIAFFGTSDFSVLCLEELQKFGLMPVVIVSSVDKPTGRGLNIVPNPVKNWALKNKIKVLTPINLNSDFITELTKDNCDLFLVASYGKIIPKSVLDLPPHGTLNIHPSLLPKYRGASPLQSQILNDEKNIGFSIMLLDEQMDHGPIITQKQIPIENWPQSLAVLKKTMARESIKSFMEVLPEWITNKITATAQNHNQVTFTKKIEKLDGELNIINGDPYKNYLKFLAYSESPKTFFFIEKDNQKIRIIVKEAKYQNGNFDIIKVLPAGKKEMLYSDFIRGLK